MAPIAHPLQAGLGTETAAPAQAARHPLNHEPGVHQPVGGLQGRTRSQRQLKLPGPVFRVELQPGDAGGLQAIEQGRGVIQPLHQPIGTVGATGHGRMGVGIGAMAGHQPLQFEAGPQLHASLVKLLLLLAATVPLIPRIGLTGAFKALPRRPGPAAAGLQQRQGRGIGPQTQIPIGARQAMGRIDGAIGPEGIRHGRKAHAHGSRRIEGGQGHHLHQGGTGMVHPGDRHPADALIGEGGNRRRQGLGHGQTAALQP